MKKIRLSLKERSYDILIGAGLLKRSGAIIRKLDIGRDACIITNKKLHSLYGRELERSLGRAGISARSIFVPDSEKAKSIKTATEVLSKISLYDKNKSVFIVALGGGVVGDLAGFVAASYKRGVPFVQIPTTLLAQVDSSIGGKVAVDLPIAKNLVGAFYQPKIVISDISLAASLSGRQLRAGLAEIIKYGVIKDPKLFSYLEKNFRKILKRDKRALEFVVARSSAIKAAVVSIDEFDNKGRRIMLNFGHTAGHAVEAASGYGEGYNHGEAIAVGMVIAAAISEKLGLLDRSAAAKIERLIKNAGLPVNIKGLKLSQILRSLAHDKKFIGGKNRFVLPTGVGSVKAVVNVPDRIVKETVKERMI